MSGTHPRLDAGLLSRVRRRESDALDQFFEHFYDRVFGYAFRLLRDRSLAEDLAHEAFLRMHRAIESLDPSRDPAPWVFTVIGNVIRDHWRSKEGRAAGRRVDMEKLWFEPATAEEEGAQQRLERDEKQRILTRALDCLSPADREVILLRSYEEFDAATVAELLDLSVDAVRQRHSRAVRRLGEHFRKLSDEDRGSP